MSEFRRVVDINRGLDNSCTREEFVQRNAGERPSDFAKRTEFVWRLGGVDPVEGIKAIGDHAEQWDGWSDAVWKEKLSTDRV